MEKTERPFTKEKRFLSLNEKNKEEKIKNLREKRKNLQVKKKKKPKQIKLPVVELKSQEHKLFFLGLDEKIRKLFL